MKQFMDENFVLETETAKVLYHKYAKDMPIYDYHCHLSPEEIYTDKKFRSITEVWLGGDHYKWRLLRQFGVDESYMTGDKSDFEKFEKYAEMMPYAIGNPIYHWTHLELQRYFGISEPLSPKNAKEVYEIANEKLKELSARKLIEMSGVTHIYTTDDPVDDLRFHKLLAEDESFAVKVAPAFRPDKAVNINLPTFTSYIEKLRDVSGNPITNIGELCEALASRIAYFDSVGCVCSDHGLDVVMYESATEKEANTVFKKALRGKKLTDKEIGQYKGYLLIALGREYAKRGWVQQYHIGALRNNSARRFRELGPDTGFDAINDVCYAPKLSAILDALDATNELPKTILYCLNPRDNELLAAMMNCFQAGGVVSKIQFGSGWWFNDQKDGMERQLTANSHFGLLSKFVGMLTDSRSFLSYTRHEYFRRILCNYIGGLVERGEYPADIEAVGAMVQDICYNNAVNYFTK